MTDASARPFIVVSEVPRLTGSRGMTFDDEQGLDPQKLLGHTSAANTKRYLRSKSVPVVSGPSIGQLLDI